MKPFCRSNRFEQRKCAQQERSDIVLFQTYYRRGNRRQSISQEIAPFVDLCYALGSFNEVQIYLLINIYICTKISLLFMCIYICIYTVFWKKVVICVYIYWRLSARRTFGTSMLWVNCSVPNIHNVRLKRPVIKKISPVAGKRYTLFTSCMATACTLILANRQFIVS